MTMSGGRLLHSVDSPVRSFTGPTFDPAASVRDNADTIAGWMWGTLRAQWCAALADDVVVKLGDQELDPAAAVAAILTAAAVDAGREARPSAWSRTIAGIAAATGLDRDDVLARHQWLTALGLTRPSVLPEHWRAN